VSSNRPADLAGLKENDIVIEFDGKPVRTAEGLGKRIDFAAPGSIVPVLVVRDGQRITIPVKMGRER
jgi:S1-C subfamily serine protease